MRWNHLKFRDFFSSFLLSNCRIKASPGQFSTQGAHGKGSESQVRGQQVKSLAWNTDISQKPKTSTFYMKTYVSKNIPHEDKLSSLQLLLGKGNWWQEAAVCSSRYDWNLPSIWEVNKWTATGMPVPQFLSFGFGSLHMRSQFQKKNLHCINMVCMLNLWIKIYSVIFLLT